MIITVNVNELYDTVKGEGIEFLVLKNGIVQGVAEGKPLEVINDEERTELSG